MDMGGWENFEVGALMKQSSCFAGWLSQVQFGKNKRRVLL